MIVNDSFRENIQKNGKQISLRLKYDNFTIEKSGIVSCTKYFKGDMFKSTMQYIDVEINGLHELYSKEVSISFGVKYGNKQYEYIDWGTYIVDNESIDKSVDRNTTKFTAYDFLYKSHILYDLQITYPITLKNYVLKVCERLGYELITTQFVNQDQMILEEKYIEGYDVTFRDVLDEIAGATGAIIYVRNNQLFIKYPEETNFIINEHNLKSLTISEKFGPINTVSISEEPQGDILYREDEESVILNGRTEIKLSNNEILKKNREQYIDCIFERVNGLSFYPFTLDSFGFCFFEPYDIVTIQEKNGIEKKCLILINTITVTQGLSETISCIVPETNETDYSKATKQDKLLYKTILSVDKQNQEINGIVERQDSISSQVSFINMNLDGIKTMVKNVEESLVNRKNYFKGLLDIHPILNEETKNNYEFNNNVIKLFVADSGWFEFYKPENMVSDFSKDDVYSSAIEMSLLLNDKTQINVDSLNAQLIIGDKVRDIQISTQNTRYIFEDIDFTQNEVYKLIINQAGVVIQIHSIDLVEGEIYEESHLGFKEISTQINQSQNTIDFVKKGLTEVVNDLDNYIEESVLEEYIRFEGAKITLGRNDSKFSVVITNQKISFLDGTTEVAYISNNVLHIEDAIINQSLTIGKFSWKPRKNGNLSLVKVK